MSTAELSRKDSEAVETTAMDTFAEPVATPLLVAIEAAPMDASAQPEEAAAPAPTADPEAWQVIPVLTRLDAETLVGLMTEIHECLAIGATRIALDLSTNQFFSLNAIQLCMSLARDLECDQGRLALVGCNERTKKHFDVYGSLKQITVVRSLTELVSDRANTVVIRSRSSQAPR